MMAPKVVLFGGGTALWFILYFGVIWKELVSHGLDDFVQYTLRLPLGGFQVVFAIAGWACLLWFAAKVAANSGLGFQE